MEAVSPELVLVDPELARVERLRLGERAALAEINAEELRRAVERAVSASEDAASSRRPWQPVLDSRVLRQAAMLMLLLAGGVLLAVTVTRERADTAVTASVSAPTRSQGVVASQPPAAAGVAAAAVARLPVKARVEQRLLLELVRTPRRLPQALVDRSTGLARNNLHARCRHLEAARYLCRVAAHGAARDLRLDVRYHPGRRDVAALTWAEKRPESRKTRAR